MRNKNDSMYKVNSQRILLGMFYQDYANWLLDGAPERSLFGGSLCHHKFSRKMGLCGNLALWEEDKANSVLSIGFFRIGFFRSHTLSHRMKADFIESDLNRTYPFNMIHSKSSKNRSESYDTESRLGICHLNEKRRQWVMDRKIKVGFFKKFLAYFCLL